MNIKFFYSAIVFLFTNFLTSAVEWQGRPRIDHSQIIICNNVIKVTGPELHVFTSDTFKAKNTEKYRISGMVRSVKGEKKFYLGVACYDKMGNMIEGQYAVPIMGSDTVLIEEIKPGDRVITVQDASNWKKQPGTFVALNIKENYADLPNRDLGRGPVTHIEQEQITGKWLVTFRLPFRKAYPAGIGIRQQHGPVYLYLLSGKTLKTEWQSFSAIVDCRKMDISNKFNRGLFPKTVAFRFVAFIPGKNTDGFEMKDIKIDLYK